MNENKVLLNEKEGGLSFAFMIVLYVCISFFGQAVVGELFGRESVAFVAICSLFSVLSMVAVIFYFTRKKKTGLIKLTGISKFRPIYLLSAAALSLGMLFGLGFINDAFAGFLRGLGLSVSSISFTMENVWHLILFSTVLALFPAVVEECFFRGVMIGSLSKCKTLLSLVTVAVCFALYHCSATQFIYQTIYGGFLCALAISSGSVLPGIIAHFINNFLIIILEYFNLSVDLYSPYIIACGIALLAVFAVTVVPGVKKAAEEKKEGKVRDFWLPFGIIAAAICSVILISGLFAA